MAIVPATEVATVSGGRAAEPAEVVELEEVVEAVWEKAIFLLEHCSREAVATERTDGN